VGVLRDARKLSKGSRLCGTAREIAGLFNNSAGLFKKRTLGVPIVLMCRSWLRWSPKEHIMNTNFQNLTRYGASLAVTLAVLVGGVGVAFLNAFGQLA
jgi:hypothetical protein